MYSILVSDDVVKIHTQKREYKNLQNSNNEKEDASKLEIRIKENFHLEGVVEFLIFAEREEKLS